MADGDRATLIINRDDEDVDSKSIQIRDYSIDQENNSEKEFDPELSASPNLAVLCPNSAGVGDDKGETKANNPTTLTRKLTFVGISITYLSVFASYALLAPFYPTEAEKKGVTATETGLVFGIFSLVRFIASPICGKYLPTIGGKFMFLSGSFVAAGCNTLFGFVDKLGSKRLFLIYSYVIRSVEAVGFAATLTAGMAIVANAFPEDVGKMTGMLEIFTGLGLTVGPPLGSLLYGIGGYKLPFLVMGCTSISLTIANMFILPSLSLSRQDARGQGSVLEMLKIPTLWMLMITLAWSSAGFAFFDPTLSLHLTSPPLNLSHYMVSVMFFLIGGVYALFSPVWGFVSDKTKATRLMIILGMYIFGISFLLVGPSSLFNLPNKSWVIIIAIIFYSFGASLCIMVSFFDLLLTATWYGHPESLATQSIVSGLYNSAYSLGSCVGPIAGGALVDHIGFDWTSTYYAGGCITMVIIIGLFGAWEYQCGKGRRKSRRGIKINPNSGMEK